MFCLTGDFDFFSNLISFARWWNQQKNIELTAHRSTKLFERTRKKLHTERTIEKKASFFHKRFFLIVNRYITKRKKHEKSQNDFLLLFHVEIMKN